MKPSVSVEGNVDAAAAADDDDDDDVESKESVCVCGRLYIIAPASYIFPYVVVGMGSLMRGTLQHSTQHTRRCQH